MSGILQIHPTRMCNLACAHCYSSSSPTQRSALAPRLVSQAIDDAAALGFDVVSLSGGEPLLYDGLEEVLRAASGAGVRVNLVSNGMLIGRTRYERLAECFNFVALSLDGLEPRHNQIRGSASSFEKVRLAAARLRASGKPFGIIHTVTSESLDALEELAAMAVDWGASLLHLHPFEATGRGHGASDMTPLSDEERVVAYVLAAAIAAAHPELKIQLDLVHRDVARRTPELLHGERVRASRAPPHVVVMQDDGLVVPLTYGLPADWLIADLRRERIATAWPRFIETRWPMLRLRMRAAALAIARGRHGEVAEWHSVLRRYARVPTKPPLGSRLPLAV